MKNSQKNKYNIKTIEEFRDFLWDRISKMAWFDIKKIKK